MRTVETIDNEINELKEKLMTVTGTDTEVYTRIVGYYRAVKNWNKGKKDEYRQRKLFSQPDKLPLREVAGTAVSTSTFVEKTQPVRTDLSEGIGEATECLYFYRATCPNCPPVKSWIENLGIKNNVVNVDEKEGFEAAAKFQIYSTPTVVFLDADGREMYRGSSVEALDALYPAVPV